MFERKSIIVFVILIVGGILGAWLVGLFEGDGPPQDISGLEFLSAIFGFFLFVFAVIGIFLVIRRNIGPMSDSEISRWEIVRKSGRRSFVRRGLIKGMLLGLISVSFLLLSVVKYSLPFSSLWVLGVILLTSLFGGYYGASRKWDSNENDYEAVTRRR